MSGTTLEVTGCYLCPFLDHRPGGWCGHEAAPKGLRTEVLPDAVPARCPMHRGDVLVRLAPSRRRQGELFG